MDDLLRCQMLYDAIGRRDGEEPALDQLRGLFKLCRCMADQGTSTTRNCLEKHDEGLNKFLTGQYWKDAGTTM